MKAHAATYRETAALREAALRLTQSLRHNPSWVLMLPAILATLVLLVFPTLYLLYMSANDWSLTSAAPPTWIGPSNYVALLRDERFAVALQRTGLFLILGLLIQIPLGLVISLLFNEEFPARGLLRTLLLLPMVATPVAMALIWVIMLDPSTGVINYLLSLVGIGGAQWLSDTSTVLPTLVAVDTWQWTPMVALICLAGLAALPTEPFEAALIDGASAWQRFWYLTLPMLRPTLMVAILFRVIDLLKVIDIIYVMTRGGPGFASETINVYNFLVGLFYYKIGYSSSIAVVIFALVLGASLMLIRVRRST